MLPFLVARLVVCVPQTIEICCTRSWKFQRFSVSVICNIVHHLNAFCIFFVVSFCYEMARLIYFKIAKNQSCKKEEFEK